MSTRTRRRLILCVVVALLTLPADLILVRAVTTDAQTSAARWVGTLSDQQVSIASGDIQNYPAAYRKEIMRRLDPARRAGVWVDHIARYRDSHPEFTTDQVDALNAAIEAAKATFARPGNSTTRANTRVVAERVTELFGADVADYLMHRLGSRQTLTLASAAPWHMRMSDWVRDRLVVQADSAGDCWCRVDFGCDVMSMTWCDGGSSVNCAVDDTWPACGWFWNEDCDGVCKVGIQT